MWPYNISEWDAISHPVSVKKKSFWKKLSETIQETQKLRAEYKIKHRLFF